MLTQTDQQVHVAYESRPEGRIATVTIVNAKRLNSFNSALMSEFVEKMSSLATASDIRAVILTGDGEKAFVGGADIKEMAAIRDSIGARSFITMVHQCCDAVRAIPVPTIARINGYTFGAGLELAASCDLRVASDRASFGMPEVKLGIPSVVEAALLPMLVGWGRTREMLLLGENFNAQQALQWGLVERVVVHEELSEAVRVWIDKLLTSTPRAVRIQKALIRSWEDLPLRAAVQAGIDAFASAFESDEPVKAMAEFLDKQAERKRRA